MTTDLYDPESTDASHEGNTGADQPRPCRLVVFAKAPVAGFAKTRLIPALGAHGAAALAQRMLLHTLDQTLASGAGTVELCMSPAPDASAWQGVVLPQGIARSDQGEGDLGERMSRAVNRVTTDFDQSILLMGTDCPELTASQILKATQQLMQHDGVLVPVVDGGYVLIGLHAPSPVLFSHMAWSTPTVAAATLQRMAALSMRVWQAPMLHDVDEPDDLVHVPDWLLSRD